MLIVISDRMNPVDEFIYLYLIKIGMLVIVHISLCILVAAYFLKAILPFFRQEPLKKPLRIYLRSIVVTSSRIRNYFDLPFFTLFLTKPLSQPIPQTEA